MTIAIERPMNNLTVVTVGEYEFAFSYSTIVAYRSPREPHWFKSENVWSQTTGRHLNSLPGVKMPHEQFMRNVDLQVNLFSAPAPVGSDEHEPLPRAWSDVPGI